MSLSSAWSAVLGALGFLRRNRRQRKAAAAKRRSMYRRHRFDALEQRVVMNADPVATDDEYLVSSSYGATADFNSYTANDTDPNGDPLGLRYDGNPHQSFTLNPGDTYSWDYVVSDGQGGVDLGQVRLIAEGTANAGPMPTVYVHQTAAGEQQGSVTVSVRLTQASNSTISVDWQASNGSAVLDQDFSSGNWRDGYYADEPVWRESGYPTYTDVWHDTSGYVMQPVHHPEGRWITESVWHEGEYVVEPVWHDDY
ncbi:MAG: LEPR-XLL domain-containing protein, partial [Planctomycetaceae bacterium]|nr:LEPR-XLL domain-containing protein [Planctomycetaceae bacterium]